MTGPVLQLKGITKRFAGIVALREVSLSIAAGEVVALVGENGAGKSTLMKILGGIHLPDSGSIQIDGHDSHIRSVEEARCHGIGFIHQELSVLENLDVAANVFLGREPVYGGVLRLIDDAKLHAAATAILGRLGAPLPTRILVRDLSIAYRQIVEIARALALETRILLMDEPTSSLTPIEAARLLSVVRDLRDRGVGIVYISHRLGEIQEIADRVVVLRDGCNAGELARQEIQHDRMVRLMVGRDLAPRRVQARAAPTPCLSVRGLRTEAYPEEALSFTIGAGEIVGFAGLIGAGRTELAQTLFGVRPLLAGLIELNGSPLRIRSPGDAIRAGLFLVPEDRRQSGCVLSMSVRENLTLATLEDYSDYRLIDFAAERLGADRLREAFSVKCSGLEQRLESLSGGNQQKVVLAKWLAHEPKLIIFDEPTRGVDVGAKAEIHELIRGLAERGVGVMLISSDMEELLAESDRIIVMHEGALAGNLDRTECSEEAILRLAVGPLSAPSGPLAARIAT